MVETKHWTAENRLYYIKQLALQIYVVMIAPNPLGLRSVRIAAERIAFLAVESDLFLEQNRDTVLEGLEITDD